jgi:NAD-dependent dihydropyrimidine dehydrogenase PreA subunit
MSETTFMGVERDKIDWKPTIDYAKCDYCMECVKFCPHQVFEVRESDAIKLIVRNPHNCVVFCRACSKTCGPDALSFPDKNATTQKIKEIRKEMESHD